MKIVVKQIIHQAEEDQAAPVAEPDCTTGHFALPKCVGHMFLGAIWKQSLFMMAMVRSGGWMQSTPDRRLWGNTREVDKIESASLQTFLEDVQ